MEWIKLLSLLAPDLFPHGVIHFASDDSTPVQPARHVSLPQHSSLPLPLIFQKFSCCIRHPARRGVVAGCMERAPSHIAPRPAPAPPLCVLPRRCVFLGVAFIFSLLPFFWPFISGCHVPSGSSHSCLWGGASSPVRPPHRPRPAPASLSLAAGPRICPTDNERADDLGAGIRILFHSVDSTRVQSIAVNKTAGRPSVTALQRDTADCPWSWRCRSGLLPGVGCRIGRARPFQDARLVATAEQGRQGVANRSRGGGLAFVLPSPPFLPLHLPLILATQTFAYCSASLSYWQPPAPLQPCCSPAPASSLQPRSSRGPQ